MKKIKQVTVGISAYNEERNIANILQDILMQKRVGWDLKEILVYSDGSTDTTVQKAISVGNKIIRVVHDSKQKGKVRRVQEIYDNAKGEILVMYDADVRIKNKNNISNLIQMFDEKNTMVVGGNTIPFKPRGFFQEAVFSTFEVFYSSRLNIKKGRNLFACTGGCLAVRTEFAKTIKFPKIKNEDTFIYFSCLAKGYDFRFAKKAVVNYKLPGTLGDYLSQVFRSNPEAVQLNLSEHFGELVKQEYDRGALFYYKNVAKVLLKNPLQTIFIIAVNISCKPFFRYKSKNNLTIWQVVASTK